MADDLDKDDDFLDDELTTMLRAAVQEELSELPTNDIEDDVDGPPREKIIDAEAGAKKVEAAEMEARRGAKSETQTDKPDDKPADQPPADTAKAETPPAAPSDLDALLDGLPDDRKTALRDRIAQADGFTSLFAGREEELSRHGATPVDAVKRFLHLNEFANKRPDEYAAWVLKEVAGDKAGELLTKAAEHLGLKVTIAQDEDDPFEDEEVKRLREENARLKGQKQFGPDAPHVQQEQVVDAYQAFVSEAGPDGLPLRPMWQALEAKIGQAAQAEKAKLGRNLNFDDLARIYSEQERAVLAARGFSAAQPAPAAAPPTQTTDAARVARAMQASKSIDGSGPGATRTPAGPPPGATIEQTIAFVMEQEGKG